ncbi:MAG: hypothetical protein ACOYM3_26495, partial [Terrimicrobiaceae bacterium]
MGYTYILVQHHKYSSEPMSKAPTTPKSPDQMNNILLKLEIITDPQEGKDLYHRDWIGMLCIDDCHLYENYAIDYIDLAKSAIVGGDYYILTCGCGVPGCARIDEPIKVVHEAERICWHVTDPWPERRFEFSRVAYSTSFSR